MTGEQDDFYTQSLRQIDQVTSEGEYVLTSTQIFGRPNSEFDKLPEEEQRLLCEALEGKRQELMRRLADGLRA